MTKDIKYRICLIGFGGLCVVGYLYMLFMAGYDRCVMDEPPTIVSGFMQTAGLFISGSNEYFLYYGGTLEITGGECVSGVQVTEKEYERHMYKE